MGLDMYLEARRFVSGYTHSAPDEQNTFAEILDAVNMTGMNDSPHITVSVNVAYWRKANHIHDWFVKNVQDGEDDCRSYYVSREKLQELEQVCRDVSANGTGEYAQKHLPTGSGFFFGSEDYDEYYFEQTDWTAKRLAEILTKVPEGSGLSSYDFHYQSSW
jgi:hypothetical protein